MRIALTVITLAAALTLTGCGNADEAPKPTASTDTPDATAKPVQGADLNVGPADKPNQPSDQVVASLQEVDELIAYMEARVANPLTGDHTDKLDELLATLKDKRAKSLASGNPVPEELRATFKEMSQKLRDQAIPADFKLDAVAKTDTTTNTTSDTAAKQQANATAFLDTKRDKTDATTDGTNPDKKSRYESDPLILNPDDPNANVRPEDLPSLQAPKVDGYKNVDFDLLSGFEYVIDEMIPDAETIAKAEADPDVEPLVVPDKRGDAQIPDDVKALNGKKVVIAGYMVPVTYREGKTNEFVLIKVVPSCFFCTQPGINDWIEIKTGEKWVDYMGDDPLYVAGVLNIGAIKEDGFTLSVYRLDAHQVHPLKIEAAKPAAAASE